MRFKIVCVRDTVDTDEPCTPNETPTLSEPAQTRPKLDRESSVSYAHHCELLVTHHSAQSHANTCSRTGSCRHRHVHCVTRDCLSLSVHFQLANGSFSIRVVRWTCNDAVLDKRAARAASASARQFEAAESQEPRVESVSV